MRNNRVFGYILSVVFVVCSLVSLGQNEKDKMIFKAMEQELDRNYKGLELDGKKPFFIEYILMTSKSWEVTASLGALLSKEDGRVNNTIGLRLLLGDPEVASSTVSRPMLYGQELAAEFSADDIRRAFWQSTDFAMKAEYKNYEQKLAYLKDHPRNPKEEAMEDFTTLPEVTTTIIESPEIRFDLPAWENKARELSEIFKEYPKLYASSVHVMVFEQVYYKKTTEGVTLRQPQTYAHVVAKATVKSKSNAVLSDQYAVIVPLQEQLPGMDELKREITAFAGRLSQFSEVADLEEPYEGPVLYEDDAVRDVMLFNTAVDGRLLSGRAFIKELKSEWFGKMGQRMVDCDFTVYHRPEMNEYHGQKLYGSYTIDAEGIRPTRNMLLMEKGVLKARLNDRMPDLEDPVSTGSLRFQLHPQRLSQLVAPGVIQITVGKKTVKDSKLKQMLLKEAKKQHLPSAFIVRKVQVGKGMAVYVYRVDVKTGEETLVPNAKVQKFFGLSEEENILAFSDQERVDNCFWQNQVFASFIYPKSFLLKKVRIDLDMRQAKAKDVIQ